MIQFCVGLEATTNRVKHSKVSRVLATTKARLQLITEEHNEQARSSDRHFRDHAARSVISFLHHGSTQSRFVSVGVFWMGAFLRKPAGTLALVVAVG